MTCNNRQPCPTFAQGGRGRARRVLGGLGRDGGEDGKEGEGMRDVKEKGRAEGMNAEGDSIHLDLTLLTHLTHPCKQ